MARTLPELLDLFCISQIHFQSVAEARNGRAVRRAGRSQEIYGGMHSLVVSYGRQYPGRVSEHAWKEGMEEPLAV